MSAETLATQVLRLLHDQRLGTLATLSQKHPGWPFASVMPYAIAADGAPFFFISGMAVHTRNVLADPRASLLVMDTQGDALTAPRATLMGNVTRVEGQPEEFRRLYLKRHPTAEQWMGFGDFAFFRLEVSDIYFVAGFGSMGWVTPAEFRAIA